MSNLHSATPAGSVASILYLACGPEQIEVVAFVQPETIDLAAEAQQVEDRIERVFKIGRVPANLELTSSAARAVVDFAKWLDSKEGKAHQEQGRQAAAKARKIDEKANAEKAAQLEAARERGRQIGTQLDAEKVQVAQTQTDRHTTARAALETEAKLAAFAIIADLGPKKAHEIYVRAGAAKERNESVFGNWLKVLNFFPAWQQETEEGKAHTESLKPRAPRPMRKEDPSKGFRPVDQRGAVPVGMGLSRKSDGTVGDNSGKTSTAKPKKPTHQSNKTSNGGGNKGGNNKKGK